MKKPISGAVLAAAVVVAVAACDSFADPTPETLSFRMDGPPGAEVALIFSKQFVAGSNELNQTLITVIDSDTLVTTLPVDTVFDVLIEKRFFVMAIPEVDGTSVQVRIDVNDRNVFNSEGDLFIEDPWRFVYLFNQLLAESVDVVF